MTDILLGILLGATVFLYLSTCWGGLREGFGKVLPFFSSARGVSRSPSPQPLGYGAPAGIQQGWVSYAFPYPNKDPAIPDTYFKDAWRADSCQYPFQSTRSKLLPKEWQAPNRCLLPANSFTE